MTAIISWKYHLFSSGRIIWFRDTDRLGTDTGSFNLDRFQRRVHRWIEKITRYQLTYSVPNRSLSFRNYSPISCAQLCWRICEDRGPLILLPKFWQIRPTRRWLFRRHWYALYAFYKRHKVRRGWSEVYRTHSDCVRSTSNLAMELNHQVNIHTETIRDRSFYIRIDSLRCCVWSINVIGR